MHNLLILKRLVRTHQSQNAQKHSTRVKNSTGTNRRERMECLGKQKIQTIRRLRPLIIKLADWNYVFYSPFHRSTCLRICTRSIIITWKVFLIGPLALSRISFCFSNSGFLRSNYTNNHFYDYLIPMNECLACVQHDSTALDRVKDCQLMSCNNYD